MSPFGQGNNKEYLIHIIAVKHLLEQDGTVQDAGKAFEAITDIRKQLKLLLEAPKDGETKAKNDEWKRKLCVIKEELTTTCKLARAETLKANKLFRCFVVGEV
jgi:hypothetical protein